MIYGLLAMMLLTVIPANRRMVKLINHNGRFNGGVDDLRKILAEFSGKTIGMGDGELQDHSLTEFRPLLVFAGPP